MELYLAKSLCPNTLSKGEDQTGESRGGAYAARAQVGVEKDGSPMYRYFKTIDEYKTYLAGKGKGVKPKGETKEEKESLKDKTDKERKKQKMLQDKTTAHRDGTANAKKKKAKDEVAKSLYLEL